MTTSLTPSDDDMSVSIFVSDTGMGSGDSEESDPEEDDFNRPDSSSTRIKEFINNWITLPSASQISRRLEIFEEALSNIIRTNPHLSVNMNRGASPVTNGALFNGQHTPVTPANPRSRDYDTSPNSRDINILNAMMMFQDFLTSLNSEDINMIYALTNLSNIGYMNLRERRGIPIYLPRIGGGIVMNTHANPPINVYGNPGESFEMNVAVNSGQPAQIVAAPADQSFEMNVAVNSGQPAQIVAALADQSVEMNVAVNSGQLAQIVAANSQIVVTWIMGAVAGLPVAHEMLIRYLGDRSEDFKYNHKILEGLSVMSLWAVIVFGVLLSLVFAFPTSRPRAMCLWFPLACFGFLMFFAVVIMIIEIFLVFSS